MLVILEVTEKEANKRAFRSLIPRLLHLDCSLNLSPNKQRTRTVIFLAC
jgi:hypothetical protein